MFRESPYSKLSFFNGRSESGRGCSFNPPSLYDCLNSLGRRALARIVFLLLVHKNPAAISAQVEALVAGGGCVVIHFDNSADAGSFDRLVARWGAHSSVVFAERVSCGWGDWSLVAATLSMIHAGLRAFEGGTHFYLLSGDCMPVMSASAALDRLAAQDLDWIEAHPFYGSDWIRTGLRSERLEYRHYFNERTQSSAFYASLKLQERMGLKRKAPEDLSLSIGSQWWCLRRKTLELILDYLNRRPDVERYFRRTWVPDESFFQSLVRTLMPDEEISNTAPTFFAFTDYGMPVSFHEDHLDLLLEQNAFFARKIAAGAEALRGELAARYLSDAPVRAKTTDGRALYELLTSKGRHGARYAQRAWEEGGHVGKGRKLYVVICKKWHVAKRLLARIAQATNMPAFGYVFDEEDASIPQIAGLPTDMTDRGDHRRAFLRLLADHYESDRIAICVDPSRPEIIQDLARDSAEVHTLFVDCHADAHWVRGHATRIGLVTDALPDERFAELIPAIRDDVDREKRAMLDVLPDGLIISDQEGDHSNTVAMADFLGIPPDQARPIATDPHLFAE